MTSFFNILRTVGEITLEHFWFPLLLWTVFAIPIILLLRRLRTLSPVHQYHSRIALILALPLGMAGSYLLDWISQLLSIRASHATAKFIVVQNPISVTATAPSVSRWSHFSDPMLWFGLTGGIILAGMIFCSIKLLANYRALQKLGRKLSFHPLDEIDSFKNNTTQVAFSDRINVPFTYGWLNQKIVVPGDLKNHPEKLQMAIRHELMHIKHHDFLLNGLLMTLKALFWFHPLVNYLQKSSREYREITCDGEVLADQQISKKKYASLLYEFAEREYNANSMAMSMAVRPSTLKKRIQTMAQQKLSTSSIRYSLFGTIFAAGLVILTISCTDISKNGITRSEIQQTQSQMEKSKGNSEFNPLLVINGEKRLDKHLKWTRIKTKYIKHMSMLKGKAATDKYGPEAKNGVIQITLNNEEKALSDLKTDKEMHEDRQKAKNRKTIFVAVERQPKLKGGMQALQQKIHYPKKAQQAGIEGKVIVKFVVNKKGNVEDPEVIRGIGGGCDKEALRVIKTAKFKPGRQRGKAVNVQYSVPFTFRLPDNSTSTESATAEEGKVDGKSLVVRNMRFDQSDQKITGSVYDKKQNNPLAGVNIRVKGTTNGTTTTKEGKFTLNNIKSENLSLIFSYVGYQSLTIQPK